MLRLIRWQLAYYFHLGTQSPSDYLFLMRKQFRTTFEMSTPKTLYQADDRSSYPLSIWILSSNLNRVYFHFVSYIYRCFFRLRQPRRILKEEVCSDNSLIRKLKPFCLRCKIYRHCKNKYLSNNIRYILSKLNSIISISRSQRKA